MRTSSRAEVRKGALDGVLLAAGPVGEQVAADLLGVLYLLDAPPQLRPALTDPDRSVRSRRIAETSPSWRFFSFVNG